MGVRRSGTRIPGLTKSPARQRAVAYLAGRLAAEHRQAERDCPYEDEACMRVWLLGWRAAAAGEAERRQTARSLPGVRKLGAVS
jgi:ribosome modulation factor